MQPSGLIPVSRRRDDNSRMIWEIQPQQNESVPAFLARRWGDPIAITHQNVEGAMDNIRISMADLEMWMG